MIRFRWAEQLLLSLATLTTAVTAAPLSAQAASFARLEAGFAFSDFSLSPVSTQTESNADTFVTSFDGSAVAISAADALFTQVPVPAGVPSAINQISAEALSLGNGALATAQSEASIIGNFLIGANETFSFNFTGFLDLETSIDRPVGERAIASASTIFALFDSRETDQSPQLLDSLEVFANLETQGDGDALDLLLSSDSSFSFDSIFGELNAGGLQESAFVGFTGSLQRTFDTSRTVTLVEIKRGVAVARVPEPTSILALLGVVGISVGTKARCRDRA